MNTHQQSGCWYIDVRPHENSEQLSLDLTQHLTRRLAVGKTLVITDDARRLLPVVRKRLLHLRSVIEHQRSRTLDPIKKEGLEHEMHRLQHFRCTRNSPTRDPEAAVYFLEPWQLDQPLGSCKTIYLTVPLRAADFQVVAEHLLPNGLVVVYGDWRADYEEIMYRLL